MRTEISNPGKPAYSKQLGRTRPGQHTNANMCVVAVASHECPIAVREGNGKPLSLISFPRASGQLPPGNGPASGQSTDHHYHVIYTVHTSWNESSIRPISVVAPSM